MGMAVSSTYPVFFYLRPPLVLRVVVLPPVLRVVVPLSVLRVVVVLLRVSVVLLSPELSRICRSTRTGWPMEPP